MDILDLPRLTWRQREWLRVAVGLVAFVGGLALVLAGQQQVTGEPMVEAVVAGEDLPSGSQVRAEDLRVTDVPARFARVGAFEDPGDVDGLLLIGPILRGEVLTTSRVLDVRDPRYAAAGRTAMPVSLPQEAGLSFLRPGQRVDVLWVPPGAGADRPAGVVVSNVTVLALPADPSTGGGLFGSSKSGDSAVILEVDSDEALALAEASSSGELSIFLRGP